MRIRLIVAPLLVLAFLHRESSAQHTNDGLCNAAPGWAYDGLYEANSCAGYAALPFCEPEVSAGDIQCPARLRGDLLVPSDSSINFSTSLCTGACIPDRIFNDIRPMQVHAASSSTAPFPLAYIKPDGTYYSVHRGDFDTTTKQYTCSPGPGEVLWSSNNLITDPTHYNGCGMQAWASVVEDGPPITTETGKAVRVVDRGSQALSLAIVPDGASHLCDSLLTGTCTVTAKVLPNIEAPSLYISIGDKDGRFVRLAIFNATCRPAPHFVLYGAWALRPDPAGVAGRQRAAVEHQRPVLQWQGQHRRSHRPTGDGSAHRRDPDDGRWQGQRLRRRLVGEWLYARHAGGHQRNPVSAHSPALPPARVPRTSWTAVGVRRTAQSTRLPIPRCRSWKTST